MDSFLLLLRTMTFNAGTLLPGDIVSVNGTRESRELDAGFADRLDAAYFDPEDLLYLPSKRYAGAALLSAGTVVLDLSDLTTPAMGTYTGDTSFTLVDSIVITNYEARGSGKILKVGGEGSSAEWYAPLGTSASGAIIDVPPGCRRVFYTQESAGYPVGARHLLKFNSGMYDINFALAILGA